MAIGINDYDLYDDDPIIDEGGHDTENEPIQNQPPVNNKQEDNFVEDFLKSKGIDDSSKIMFEGDNGELIERSWDSLSNEEKFNILNTNTNSVSEQNQLSEEELDFINELRANNLTPSQYLSQFTQQNSQEPQYQVDDLSDDEIFLLDLESRVGELTDEQAAQALANSKQDEDLFKKQVIGIRNEYKERENYQIQQQQAELEAQQQEAYNQFQDSVINSISNFNSIGNLDLNFDDSDKNELAEFMLSRDESGNNYLWQALQDPDTLTKAAWFILNGDDALNNIAEYFTNQIKLVSEHQYNKGFQEGKQGITPSRPTVVINNTKSNNQHRNYTSIEDLDDED